LSRPSHQFNYVNVSLGRQRGLECFITGTVFALNKCYRFCFLNSWASSTWTYTTRNHSHKQQGLIVTKLYVQVRLTTV